MESLCQAASPNGLESAMQHHLLETFDSPHLKIHLQCLELLRLTLMAQSA